MAETGSASDASRPKVYVSYAREDAAFAGRLGHVLNDRGFETVMDREELDAEEAWKARARPLIVSSDQAIVILTAKSALLESVQWEAELAVSSGKRLVVVVPAPLKDGMVPRPPIATSPWFHFYQHPTRSDSGIFAGPALEAALKADLAWRRQYTSLFLLAEKWRSQEEADELLLRGEALAAALDWRESMPPGQILVSEVADFLTASEEAGPAGQQQPGAFESRLLHLEQRRTAAQEAARAKLATVETRREDPPPAPRILTPGQLADVPLAPPHTPASLLQMQPADIDDDAWDASSDDELETKVAKRKKSGARAKGGLAAPALIAVLMFLVAGGVVWQVLPQYLESPGKVAAADPAAAPTDAMPAALLAEASEVTAAPEVAPQPVAPASTPPVQTPTVQTQAQSAPAPAAPKPAAATPAAPKPEAAKPEAAKPEPAKPEPARPAADASKEDADWRTAREVGNVAAYRTFLQKWPESQRRDQALSAAKKRIATLSTKPATLSVTLPGPVAYRELPTFRDKGANKGAAGQTITIVDRIASPREGEWLVLEQDGDWPFRFISARDIEGS